MKWMLSTCERWLLKFHVASSLSFCKNTESILRYIKIIKLFQSECQLAKALAHRCHALHCSVFLVLRLFLRALQGSDSGPIQSRLQNGNHGIRPFGISLGRGRRGSRPSGEILNVKNTAYLHTIKKCKTTLWFEYRNVNINVIRCLQYHESKAINRCKSVKSFSIIYML